MIILFQLPGLSQDETYWVILAFCALMVFLVFWGDKFFLRRKEKSLKTHKPTNFYLLNAGYPRKVIVYEENELKCINENYDIWTAKATGTLEDGDPINFTLADLEPMAWETIDGKWNDKRIWRIRPKIDESKVLEKLNEAEIYVNTIIEAYRKSRTIPEQFEEQNAEHFKKVREAVVPPVFVRPQDKRGYGQQEVNQ